MPKNGPKSNRYFSTAWLLLAIIASAPLLGCREQPATVTPSATSSSAGTSPPEADSRICAASNQAPQLLVFGSLEESRAWLEAEDWWGGNWQQENLSVPHVLITGITKRWRAEAQVMTVPEKKEAFFRLMLPLVLHANELVLNRRHQLEAARMNLIAGGSLSHEQMQSLSAGLALFRVAKAEETQSLEADSPALVQLIDALLFRLDIVPPGLVLGQAAYESGWGTSRFAQQGNALFGQWTYGGTGIAPEQQRRELGDHRIAAFEWPFDSVRSYFINLASHPSYEDFRRLRAERRAAGATLDSVHLADGLVNYSERGRDYVEDLKRLIRSNRFELADSASFRDEPLRFYIGAEDAADANRLRAEVAHLRESGEWSEICKRMRLE